MRLLSALTRWAIISALLFVVSCASAPPAAEVESVYSLEGELAVIGEHPFDRRIVLADSAGKFWNLNNPELHGELVNLAGHRIRVTGTYEDAVDGSSGLHVDSYNLLPVEGKTPIVGILVDEGTRLILVEGNTRERYLITGPLSGALLHFQGFKVWAYGDEKRGLESAGNARILVVQGYGILGPLDESSNYVPSDTLRDLNNR